MLGDVTPSQLRLIQTGTVYTGRDNKFTVTVQKYVGRKYAPADLSEVTQLLLIIPGAEPVVIDSLTYPDAFSVAGSLLTLDLSDFAFAPGTYTAQLVAFDAEHPRGQVLCETYENELTFTVRDVSANGSVPLPTLSYVEEAPANGVTYGRRDGVWVTIEAQVAGVASFNGRTGGVTLLSSDVTSALGFTPLQQSDLPVLATVATSGSYADLTNKPFIPSTAGDVGAATAAQGALADTAVQPQVLADGLATKVDKVVGKQLSTEDFTSAEKAKLAGLEGSHYRGTFTNLTALQTALPTASAGDYADVDAGAGSPVLRYIWDTDDGWTAQAGAADPITAAQVKTLYESNADTNAFTDSEKTKLAGIAAGATANTSTDTLAEGSTNLWFTAARVRATVLTGLSLATDAVIAATDSVLVALGKLQAQITAMRTKLDGIAPNATANQTDAYLLARANHTGTQASTTISDFAEAVQDVMGATLVQGANVTITYDDAANTITIAAAAAGGTLQPWSAVAPVAATATLALADAGKYMRCTSATAVTLTVPPQSSVAWAADTEIHIEQGAAGAVTIAAGAGVTINKPTGYNAKTMSQYAVVTLKRVAADTWTLIGALEVPA